MFHPATTTLALAATFLFAGAAAAQIQIRGQVEAGQVSTCYYCPTVTSFVIHGSETPIRSSSIDFSALVGQTCIFTGTWGGTAALPIFDVTAAQLTSSLFSIHGNSSLGNTVRFQTSAGTGDIALNLIGLNAGAFTLTDVATFLLNPSQSAVLGMGTSTNGTVRTDLVIPSTPALVGMHFFGQAVILPANGAPFFTTEPDHKRVQ